MQKKEITQCMLISPDQAPTHLPHTHSWDSSPFTEAQRTQPSPFDHRTHTLYGRTGLYVFMALLTKFLGNYHSFHRITTPTHIFGTPLLLLRHNEPNPVSLTTGNTPNMDGQGSTSLWLYYRNFSEITTLFTASPPPHTVSGLFPFH